jgi:hypothetical protein
MASWFAFAGAWTGTAVSSVPRSAAGCLARERARPAGADTDSDGGCGRGGG